MRVLQLAASHSCSRHDSAPASACVPRRITCETRTSPASPVAFFHLAIAQAWFHLPSAHGASSTAKGKPWTKSFVPGITSQPYPSHLLRTAQPGAQFVQWEVGDPELAKAAFEASVCACCPARVRKARAGRLSIALRPVRRRKHPTRRPARDPHQSELLRGSFQTVEGRSAPGRLNREPAGDAKAAPERGEGSTRAETGKRGKP